MAAVDPIFPVVPDITVINGLSPLDSSMLDAAFREGLSFNSGVEIAGRVETWPSGCAPSLIEDTDESNEVATDTWKKMTGWGEPVEFTPFLVYLILNCPAGLLTGMHDKRRAALLKTAFDAAKHQGLATQLWYGSADPTATVPTLRDSAGVPAGFSTAADVVTAISELLQAHKELGTGRTFIHGPWALVPVLQALNLIENKGGVLQGVGWQYVTDDAYPLTVTAGPIQTPHTLPTLPDYYADVANTAWLYATGRVEYAWGGELNNTTLGVDAGAEDLSNYSIFDSRKNRSLVRVEQQAFVRFDTGSVLAHRVELPAHA